MSVIDFSVPTKKRDGYLEWSDYFMAIAFLSAQRSKDPKTQVITGTYQMKQEVFMEWR